MTADGLPLAMVSHESPGRLRLRIPEKRADAAYFTHLEDELSALPAVFAVQANALTAGVLIRHEGLSTDALTARGAERALFALQAGGDVRPQTVIDKANRLAAQVEAVMQRSSRGEADIPSVLFLIFMGLGLTQLLRGQVMAPAASLLWYAFEIMRQGQHNN